MLVKFLSYTASMVGTGRHKPFLFLIAAALFAITGSTLVSVVWGSNGHTAASVQQKTDAATEQQGSAQLGSLERQNAKKPASEQSLSSQNQQTSTNTSTETRSTTNTGSGASNMTTSISVSSSSLTLSGQEGQASISASLSGSGNSNVTWSITAETSSEGLSVNREQTTNSSTVFTFRTQNASAGTYQFTISAKDAQNTVVAKTSVSVTVTP